MTYMRLTQAIFTFGVLCVLCPRAAWSTEPSATAQQASTPRHWLRRHAEVARILPDQLATLREHASRSASTVQPILRKHGFKNESLFAIALEPNVYCALRYYEYYGSNFANDVQRLEQNNLYKEWSSKLNACLADKWADVQCVFFTEGQQRASVEEGRVKRLGRVIGLRPEMARSYVLLHAHTWPGVLAAIREGNIRNYSIFLAPVGAKLYLFAYLEYVGDDFETDMARIGSDPDTKAWIKFTDEGCQLPIPTRKPGEWWAGMERL
jgi:L-rhamnose mutarotase